MIVSIHQPNYIPWLGYFEKILRSDIFVFLDDVQYEKNYLINRNKIRTNDGSMWMTIPVNAKHDSIVNNVRIDNSQSWADKHKKSIQINYAKSDFLQNYLDFFNALYEQQFELLIDINMEVIRYLMKQLDIGTKTIFSSELHV
ncbi:MAG: WbqC family protein, partial [Thaumarchaeota archaeon]|nr:WbqC family protein [Nitrososphaerota archaeon]